jgi:hypothetical protein
MANKKLHWLAPLNREKTPVTFGVPWAKGELKRDEDLALLRGGEKVPVQTKNTAFWPDGSVKWTAHSAVLETDGDFSIQKGEGAKAKGGISARQEAGGSVVISSDMIDCRIEKGDSLIASLVRKDRGFVPMSARLIALVENVQGEEEYDQQITVTKLSGVTNEIVLEEAGPLRAVVKLTGNHAGGGRALFPFVIRLYFHQGSSQVKIVHTFIFEADEKSDFLKGIAVEMQMGASGELFNRHVGFACEKGLFYEGVQGMYTGGGSYRRGARSKAKPFSPEERLAIYAKQQTEGQFVQADREQQPDFYEMVDDNAFWNDFRLTQDSCDHYAITKRTVPGCAHILANQGARSNGAVFFGSEGGIVAAAVRDMWQKAPMALEVTGAAGESPKMTIWLWSRYAQPMDFRAYDVVSHFYSYGGVVNHPEGIANTNEIYLNLFDSMPGKQAIWDFAADSQEEALLVLDYEDYEKTNVFGAYWHKGKEDRPEYDYMEKGLVNLVRFYMDEVERRKWYGFWDFGDVMHTYDTVRHCWRYDVGGFAWQNTELCNTYVNWLVFLRTGDYDIYKFARAMSRHCSEVDTYHSGKYKMLGGRHNVRHWGCGAKEARISMAGHHRFYYYLTGDERIGDVMDEVKDVDFYTLVKDPMGTYFPPHENFSHVRVGPDWSSFAINWMTRWERFEDEHYKEKLLKGLNCIKSAPLGLSSGSTYHYDPKTGMMHYMGEENPAGHTHLGDGNYQQHMVICFGAPETLFELADWLEDEELKDQMAQFGAFYAMTPEEREEASGGRFNEENNEAWSGEHWATRMIAYAGVKQNNDRYLKMALDQLEKGHRFYELSSTINKQGEPAYIEIPAVDSPNVEKEVPTLSTNTVSQWSLNFMETINILDEKDKSE